jgi:hypothetical protein
MRLRDVECAAGGDGFRESGETSRARSWLAPWHSAPARKSRLPTKCCRHERAHVAGRFKARRQWQWQLTVRSDRTRKERELNLKLTSVFP